MRNIDLETLDLSKVGPDELAGMLGTQPTKVTRREPSADDGRDGAVDTLIEKRHRQRVKAEGERILSGRGGLADGLPGKVRRQIGGRRVS